MRKPLSACKYLIVASAVLTALVFVLGKKSQSCTGYANDGAMTVNGTKLVFELASTIEEQELGLSGRACISEGWAMLFTFPRESTNAIWMKDMKFSIDVVWLDSDKKVVYSTENFAPESYPEIRQSSVPSRYVIELPSGSINRYGIVSGTQFSW